MRYFKQITIFISLLYIHNAMAQNGEKLIEKQIDQMISDYNMHSFKNMDSYTTEDVEWVNIVGMHWKGRNEVKMAHQNIFDTIFKNVPFTKKSFYIRFLTTDVAVVNLVCHVGEFYPPDGVDHGNNKMPEADNMLTLVYVKTKGNWLLASGQNTVVDARVQANNPAK